MYNYKTIIAALAPVYIVPKPSNYYHLFIYRQYELA